MSEIPVPLNGTRGEFSVSDSANTGPLDLVLKTSAGTENAEDMVLSAITQNLVATLADMYYRELQKPSSVRSKWLQSSSDGYAPVFVRPQLVDLFTCYDRTQPAGQSVGLLEPLLPGPWLDSKFGGATLQLLPHETTNIFAGWVLYGPKLTGPENRVWTNPRTGRQFVLRVEDFQVGHNFMLVQGPVSLGILLPTNMSATWHYIPEEDPVFNISRRRRSRRQQRPCPPTRIEVNDVFALFRSRM